MKNLIISKLISGALTLAFMAAVRPDPKPTLAESAFVAVLFYEMFQGIIYTALEERASQRKKKKDKYTTIEYREITDKYGMTRWAKTRVGR